MLDLIPQMTHPLSVYWDQPPLEDIAVYNDIAIMDQKTLDKLPEYSFSVPSGAYAGKMWKTELNTGWLLRWYEKGLDPKTISINHRPIRILRGE